MDRVHPERIPRVGRQCALLNPRRTYRFYTYAPADGGGGWCDPPSPFWPLIELELREKNERVVRYETQRLIRNLRSQVNR